MTENLSVVMISYHTGPSLWMALEAALAQAGLKELILVNNGNPTDVTQRLHRLAEIKPALKILDGHGNVGFARGCNLGAAHASGTHLLLLNPDCILPPVGAEMLMDALAAHPTAVMAGPRIVHPDGSEQAGDRRMILTPLNGVADALGLHRFFPHLPRFNLHRDAVPTQATPVPAISGACMLIAREKFLSLGGMDEQYFLHVEDLDFCRRIAEQGGSVLFVPQVTVLHFLSTSAAPSLVVEAHKMRGFCRYFQHPSIPKAQQWLGMGLAVAKYAMTLAAHPLRGENRASNDALRRLLWLHHKRWLDRSSVYQQPATPAHIPLSGPILLTGASSPLGIALLRRLLNEGVSVVAMRSRQLLPFHHPKLRWVLADLQQSALSLPEMKASVLIHVAPIWLLKPEHIAHYARLGVTRLIAFSSSSIEGKASSRDASEQHVVRLLQQGEAQVKQACAVHGIHFTLFRPTLIYGLGLDHNIASIQRFIKRFGFFPVAAPAQGMRQPVHVDDLARAALSVLHLHTSFDKTYTLCGGEALSYTEMVARVSKSVGRKPRILAIPHLARCLRPLGKIGAKASALAERMNQDLVFDHSTAVADFGYAPRMFEPLAPEFPWPAL
jgi:GT2 family glycosyltransferase/nucleoside-diphosphate-sugar epimerase